MLRARTFALRFKSQNIKNRYTMKKIIKAISLIAFSAALAACSDNGAGTRETEVNVNDIAGTYGGSFALSVGGSSQGTETLNCTITYKTDSTVDIALDEFTAMGTMKFSLSAEDVAVAEAADGYSLSGEIDTVSGETKVTGSVSGTVGSDGTAEITFVFTPGAMPMSITGVFTSPAPDEGSGDSAVEGGNE